MSNFNYWWVLAPMMMVGAFALGWFATGIKGCKPHRRPVVKRLCLPYAVVSAMSFGYLLLAESWLGFVQVGLGMIVPELGESEFWAGVAAVVGIIISVIVFFCIQICCSGFGDWLKGKYLSYTDGRKRRAFCRSVSPDYAAKVCPCGRDEKCPCGINRRVRLNASSADIIYLVEGLTPLFEQQIAMGHTAECLIKLPVVNGEVVLSRAEAFDLLAQAYELGEALPRVVELDIQRPFLKLVQDQLQTAYRLVRTNLRVALGKRTA